MAEAKKENFVLSFGDGGIREYKVVDNVSYVFTLTPKDIKEVPDLFNNVLSNALVKVKNSYRDKADGFVNIKVQWSAFKDSIIFQIFGDIIEKTE
ncbi:hypothetical protein [Nitrosophilus alvini]|uniref:hypothetical protein n=1 Tax=Nitrosophilus alvini TaxID=2714855 RepID=UPI00190B49BC|nr:hypothetical protein [Nitrosophilus alvini]